MTRDEIIRMARSVRDGGHWNQLDLINFAAIVAAAEREACAKVAEETICDTHLPTGVRIYGTRAARAIRARGQQPDTDNPSF